MNRKLPLLNTGRISDTLREKSWRPDTREILVARFEGSDQEADLTVPPNCDGLGRLRHFNRATAPGWPDNPLPIEPAERYLRRSLGNKAVAQVFQNLACNWRCWYCYVPFNLLNGNESRGRFVTASELVGKYLGQIDPPPILDMSGGQPDLVPEWTLDTLRAVKDAGAATSTFVWSDDNLSTDYLWRYLSRAEIAWMAEQPNHSRVGCFKGFDANSFTYNTRAAPMLFDSQFEFFNRLRSDGFELFGYVTLTSPDAQSIDVGVSDLVDRLQRIHGNLPLRVIPLKIELFGPVHDRLTDIDRVALENQNHAARTWGSELERRFSRLELDRAIADVDISN